MTVRQTSIQAYREEQKHFGDRCKLIHWYIRNFPCRTDRELARLMGFSDPNSVRPRRKEFCDAGLVVEAGKRVCTVSGKTAHVWRVANDR
jgi:hypothetical protein